tara:strand:+ start:355 stop:558 length:204 start_codon:yes stop_codon:yes gene_type:complete
MKLEHIRRYNMITENEIKDQIQIGLTHAENMEYWDGEPEYLEWHNGYMYALNFVLGTYKAKYNKEDI